MNTVYFDNRELKVPSTWNELSPQQLLDVVTIQHSQMSLMEAKLRILFSLLDVRQVKWLRRMFWRTSLYEWLQDRGIKRWVPPLSLEAKADLLMLTDWTIEKKCDLTRQLLLRIHVGRKVFFGPRDKLAGVTLWEFIEADEAFLHFSRSTDEREKEKYLTQLVSVLYREKKKNLDPLRDGDWREPFNLTLARHNEKHLGKASRAVKLAVMMYFLACKEDKMARYSYVFRPGQEDEVENRSNSTKPGWVNAVRSMAGGALKMEAYFNVSAELALDELNAKIKEHEEWEAKNKKK